MKFESDHSVAHFRVRAGEQLYDFSMRVAGDIQSYDEISLIAHRNLQSILAEFGSIAGRLQEKLDGVDYQKE